MWPLQENSQHPNRYMGEVYNGQMQGAGCRFYIDGTVVKGEYHYGNRQREGKWHMPNGDFYEGGWYNDQMRGSGALHCARSGNRFEGYFANGKKTGRGEVHFADGGLRVHLYKNDHRVGDGVFWSKDLTQAWRVVLSNESTGRRHSKSPWKALSFGGRLLSTHEMELTKIDDSAHTAVVFKAIGLKKARKLEIELKLATSRLQIRD